MVRRFTLTINHHRGIKTIKKLRLSVVLRSHSNVRSSSPSSSVPSISRSYKLVCKTIQSREASNLYDTRSSCLVSLFTTFLQVLMVHVIQIPDSSSRSYPG